MRRRYARAAMAAILLLSLGACSATTGPKQTGGTLVGAALGGLLGSKFGSGSGQLAAVAAGTLVGAFVGHGIGESLDRADQVYAQRSAHQGLETQPSGTTSGWTNPDSGHSGTFTPDPYLQIRSRRLLPGVSADSYDRWADRKRLWHRVPPARWQLGNPQRIVDGIRGRAVVSARRRRPARRGASEFDPCGLQDQDCGSRSTPPGRLHGQS